MIPATLLGLLFEEQMEQFFSGNVPLVGYMLIVTALLLYLADKAKDTNKSVSYLNALIIGISQAIAILPGVSRSGATIGTSVLLGIDRGKAARFSFLMVVPLILGKMAKDFFDFKLAEAGPVPQESIATGVLIAGFIAAFITGYFACTWMIKLVKRSKLTYFSIYCFIIGAIAITWELVA